MANSLLHKNSLFTLADGNFACEAGAAADFLFFVANLVSAGALLSIKSGL
jgi:hypothetical protein